jgi:serine/threonine protein kinase
MGKMLDENDFKWYQMLGVGSFGIVFHATRKATGTHYAIKLQTMDTLRFNANKKTREKNMDPTMKIHIERTVLAACNGHPFIINMAYAFTTERYAALVLDFMAGTQYSYRTHFQFPNISQYCLSLFCGVSHSSYSWNS